jgi:CPA2 family monovalent cation:H+ antiporter-2
MHDFPLISTLAIGFTAAWLLGLLTQRLRLSPIVGYLLAGVLVGSHTPGFVADAEIAHQLAEVGVILLMFGVGLHFHLEDLLAVKWVAIPGAVGQSLAATLVSMVVFSWFGMPYNISAVLGMAMAVASTVVLMRVLMDADALNTPQGHIAVGWLLVEDVFTVIVLVLIPALGTPEKGEVVTGLLANPAVAICWALLKLAAMVVVILVVGAKVVPWALVRVAKLRSRELFTLTVLVFSVAIASGAFVLFGASMALGAFLAGMVVALSPVSHQAAADALPLRDAFAVIFFVSVGMIFDPAILWQHPFLMLAAMGIILIVKPLAALLIVGLLGHSVRTSLTVALGLAQIGEFSFILSDLARKYGLMTDEGHSVLVGGAILSITLNPMLFRTLPKIEAWLRTKPRLWQFLNARAERRITAANDASMAQIASYEGDNKLAIVIGYGPVGRAVDKLLRDAGMDTVVIDMNMDTISELHSQRRLAVFGDAAREAILEQAGAKRASHLVLTLPAATGRAAIVSIARNLNPKLRILVRAHYLREREHLEQAGATAAVFEEGEAAVALARLVLVDTGASKESVEHAVRDIRTQLILENFTNLQTQTVRSIMVPWTRVRRLSSTATIDEVRRQVAEHHFSRWPIVAVETGRTSSYLLAKDLVIEGTDGHDWLRLARPLTVISADTDVEHALEHFQRENATVSLVEDHSSPVGLITIEDILEQVVGRIEDEYPREPRIILQEALMAGGIVMSLEGSTPQQVISELAANIPHGSLPVGTDVTYLALERERELPTCLGCGVAIPHARVPGLTKPLVVFGRSQEGVLFNPQSDEIVRLVFLLVTPEDKPEVQVVLLSQLASLAGNSDSRDRLERATSVPEVMEIFSATTREEAVAG